MIILCISSRIVIWDERREARMSKWRLKSSFSISLEELRSSHRWTGHRRMYARIVEPSRPAISTHRPRMSAWTAQVTERYPFRLTLNRTLSRVCISSAVLRHRQRVSTDVESTLWGTKSSCNATTSRLAALSKTGLRSWLLTVTILRSRSALFESHINSLPIVKERERIISNFLTIVEVRWLFRNTRVIQVDIPYCLRSYFCICDSFLCLRCGCVCQ